MSRAVDSATSGARIRAARRAAQLTQAALADRAGLSKITVSKLENDRLRLSADVALRIARACGNSPELLLPGLGWAPAPARVLSLRPAGPGLAWVPLAEADAQLARQVAGTYWGHPFRLVELARENGVAVLYRGDLPVAEGGSD